MKELPRFLNLLLDQYHRREYLGSDPLEFPHRYSDPHDQEAIALVSALLAYGNVKQIRRSVADVIRRIDTLGNSPSGWIRTLDQSDALERAQRGFATFKHRFNVGADLVRLFRLLNESWRIYGSLGAHFMSHLTPTDADVSHALDLLIQDWRKWAGPMKERSFRYLLTSPADGSTCKRWCMFLRWVGRTDSGSSEKLDLGLWAEGSVLARGFSEGRFLREDQLILPLDTHTGRISQYLGLTSRKSLGWKAATEVTRALKACHPTDPTRYDFALARLGILSLCKKTYRPEICLKCQLVTVCRFAQKGRARDARKKTRK